MNVTCHSTLRPFGLAGSLIDKAGIIGGDDNVCRTALRAPPGKRRFKQRDAP
jgi:hypothetical protein